MSSETCPINPLGDVFNMISEPIEISGTITNKDLNEKLKMLSSTLDKLNNTASDSFKRAETEGKINANLLLQEKSRGVKRPHSGGKRRYKGGSEEADKKALVVVLIITLLLCDIIYGDDNTKLMREYIIDTSKNLAEPILKNLNDMFNAVIQSYVKALPGISSGCTTNIDYSIDVLRELPFIGSYVSLDNKLPTCAQRMLSFNETVASLRKVGMEVSVGIVALLGATTAGMNYRKAWNANPQASTVDKIAAVCSAMTSDTYKLGGRAISSVLYLPMASARALSDIVPAVAGNAWKAATNTREWFESWSTLNTSTIANANSFDTSGTTSGPTSGPTSADTSGPTSDGAASDGATPDGTTPDGTTPDEESNKRQRTDTGNGATSGGRRTRSKKSPNKKAKKSRKQKKKHSSTKHKRHGRKTRRGGMSCGKHKKTKRKPRR